MWSNPSLQRTRLRSPLNSISLGTPKSKESLLEIPFSGTLNEPLLRRAFGRQALGPRVIGAFLLGVAVLGLVLFVRAPDRRAAGLQLAPPIFLGFLGTVLLLTPYFSARRTLRTNQLLRSPQSGHASEVGVTFTHPLGAAALPWSVFYRAVVSKNVVLLYQSANVSHVLPREFFHTDTAWASFQSLVRQHAPRPPSRFLRLVLVWLALVVFFLLLSRFLGGA